MYITVQRHLPIPGTFNIRDLGGYAAGSAETRWRRILRADGLHHLDAAGMTALTGEGVTTVIDLRHDHELQSRPNPFHGHPTVAYHNVSLFERLAPADMSVSDVLLDLYIQALTTRHGAISQVLTLIAEAPRGVVLFHCTAGKDRTGLVAALLLALAGVADATILDDYALTKLMIAPLLDRLIAEAEERDADLAALRPLLACEPQTMAATIAHILDNHGSVEAYLLAIGLSDATIARLKARLLEDA
ncbi:MULTISPECIES: tyrosine-protein phosphatase [Bradyrhizobium]|nr:tyrosine-protein phosphatase [Bradyrhizobium vignae]SPP92457.1 Protein tyrosine/serine phosphatase [Bradyrhizobium vignae]